VDAEASRPDRSGPGPWVGRAAVLAGAVAVVTVAWANRSTPPIAFALAAVVAISVRLAAIDLREHRLPNRLVVPLAAAVTAGLLVGLTVDLIDGDGPGRAVGALVLGVVTAAVLLVGHLTGGVGMGDVKYGYVAGATLGWLGLDAFRFGIVVTLVTAAVGGGVLLASGVGRDHRLAFGPFLVAGLVAGSILGAP
jgi:leader peptidase (prepilin peptidase) / N-methyltransferase